MQYKGVFFLRKFKNYVNGGGNGVLFRLLLYFCTRFWNIKQKNTWAVLYDQLPRNPPGWEHSKGTWL